MVGTTCPEIGDPNPKKVGPSWAQTCRPWRRNRPEIGFWVSGLISLVPHLARHGLGPFRTSAWSNNRWPTARRVVQKWQVFFPKKWHGLPRWKMIIHGNLGYPIFGKNPCKTMLLTSDGDGVYTLTACEQLLAGPSCPVYLITVERFSPNAINHLRLPQKWVHLTRLGVQFWGGCSNYFWWRWGW